MEEITVLKNNQQLIKENPEKIVKMFLSDDPNLFPQHGHYNMATCKETKVNFSIYDDILNGVDVNKMPFNEDVFEIDPTMYKSQEIHDYVTIFEELKRKRKNPKE